MSTRGVKFLFKSGEHVLCFEPDSSKAKVLYDARVLDVSVSTDKKGKRRPSYLIHFLGWNNSWDRVVPESFLLKENEVNRALMGKLSAVCQRVKRSRILIKKIDNILEKHFQKKNSNPNSVDAILSSESESTDEEMDDDDENMNRSEISRMSTEECSDVGEDNPESDDSDNSSLVGSSESINVEVDTKKEPVHLELSDPLKRKLENDCFLIKKKNKLLKLPAEQNVITILESYVKSFAVNILCASVDKQKSHHLRSQNQQTPDRSIELCKEVMDGLRIIFDFTLPLILLYKDEREQFKILSEIPLPAPTPSAHVDLSRVDPEPRSNLLTDHQMELASLVSMTSETSSEDDVTQNAKEDDMIGRKEESPPRRVTRRSSGPSDLVSGIPSKRSPRRSVRGSARTSTRSSHPPKLESASPLVKLGSALTSKSDVVDPLPTPTGSGTVVPSTGSLQPSSGPHLLFVSKLETESQKELAVNDIFSWKLVVDDLYKVVPVPPSLLYGSHHLLRLFVKLPQLLSGMDISSSYLPHLVKHLEMFLEHLTVQSEEMFPESPYLNSKQALAHLSSK